MNLFDELDKSGELLSNVECPVCRCKGAMHFYKHSDILALDNTVVCGGCGTAYSDMVFYTQSEKVVNGKICGHFKRFYFPVISANGVEYETGDAYFEPLGETIAFER